MSQRNGFNRRDLPQVCTDKCRSRKETLEQLIKLTKEVTSNFKKNPRVSKGQLNAFSPQNQNKQTTHHQTVCVDGKPGVPIRVQKQRRMFGNPTPASHGPALSPTHACYTMTDLCNKIEKESGPTLRSRDVCKCDGCKGPCSAVGPHIHTDPSLCLRDYCNYPCFKPPMVQPSGNQWSGEVHTDCIHPWPCKADCFDHLPPRDWSNYMHRKG